MQTIAHAPTTPQPTIGQTYRTALQDVYAHAKAVLPAG